MKLSLVEGHRRDFACPWPPRAWVCGRFLPALGPMRFRRGRLGCRFAIEGGGRRHADRPNEGPRALEGGGYSGNCRVRPPSPADLPPGCREGAGDFLGGRIVAPRKLSLLACPSPPATASARSEEARCRVARPLGADGEAGWSGGRLAPGPQGPRSEAQPIPLERA